MKNLVSGDETTLEEGLGMRLCSRLPQVSLITGLEYKMERWNGKWIGGEQLQQTSITGAVQSKFDYLVHL